MPHQIPIISERLRFASLEQCDAFKNKYNCELLVIEAEMVKIFESVCYAECWLCGKADSVVVGFNEYDEIVIQENLGMKILQVISQRKKNMNEKRDYRIVCFNQQF